MNRRRPSSRDELTERRRSDRAKMPHLLTVEVAMGTLRVKCRCGKVLTHRASDLEFVTFPDLLEIMTLHSAETNELRLGEI